MNVGQQGLILETGTASRRHRRGRPALLAVVVAVTSGCTSGGVIAPQDASGDGEIDSGDAAPGGDGGPSNLKWYMTCGDPVCRVPTDGGAPDGGLQDDAGASCPPIGSSCSTQGQTCGTYNPFVNCGAIEVCSDHDPKLGVGGCPISSRAFKDDIEYVDDAQLERLHDETLRIRLATYSYKVPYADPNPKHLGFIIEDDLQSPAVNVARDRVDMYGYLSMVVATMQVQEKEIADLRRALSLAQARTCDSRENSESR